MVNILLVVDAIARRMRTQGQKSDEGEYLRSFIPNIAKISRRSSISVRILRCVIGIVGFI